MIRMSRYIRTLIILLAAVQTVGTMKAQDETSGTGGTASTGPTVRGNVFGGGNLAKVEGSVTVNVSAGTVANDVYGGGNKADVNGDTQVNLLGGIVNENVYGGGRGTDGAEGIAALVGSTQVNLNGMDASEYKEAYSSWGLVSEGDGKPYTVANTAKGCVVGGSIFGCNNINGTPQGDATVHVYKTQNANATQIGNAGDVTNAKEKGRYDLTAVYGGGNLAAFIPAAANESTASTHVIIDGCDLTSIETVYGGGNAASTPATDVTVKGTFEIKELFGGGNGLTALPDGRPNPGANVGYKNYTEYVNVDGTLVAKDKEDADTKEKRLASGYVYGSGAANVTIYGGTIHQVFGGSNTKGNVRISAVTLLEDQDVCEFCVDEAYGGGKSAPMDAEAKLLMSCIPGLKAAYGGAEAADINGDVVLNITNGTFDRVFGGNNISGTIRGSITVNIEETGCKPIIIGELYGGGNQAGYSVYGYKQVNEGGKMVWNPRESATDEGTGPATPYNDPQVNVRSFTSIGEIYGGGYGETAVMVGSPTVNINVGLGEQTKHDNAEIPEGTKLSEKYPIPSHVKGKIGAINNVYGGGNAAKVVGNTTVNIGTLSEVTLETKEDDSATTDTDESKLPVQGADIRGNVYGGGNAAEVTGNTNVNIGKEQTTPAPPVTPAPQANPAE